MDKLISLSNIFYKLTKKAGDSLIDDLAQHTYVNAVLSKQIQPPENWSEVYVNYSIEGARRAVKYGAFAFAERLERLNIGLLNQIKNIFIKLKTQNSNKEELKKQLLEKLQLKNANSRKNIKTIISRLRNLDLSDSLLASVKDVLLNNFSYNTEYRKPWIIAFDRYADLVHDFKELESAEKTKNYSEIFKKKLDLRISLNMFYDASHSSGSFLEHLVSAEIEDLYGDTISDDEKLDKEDILSDKIIEILDSSRFKNPNDTIHIVKKHLSTPGKFKDHQDYTGTENELGDENRIKINNDILRLNKRNSELISSLKDENKWMYNPLTPENINIYNPGITHYLFAVREADVIYNKLFEKPSLNAQDAISPKTYRNFRNCVDFYNILVRNYYKANDNITFNRIKEYLPKLRDSFENVVTELRRNYEMP